MAKHTSAHLSRDTTPLSAAPNLRPRCCYAVPIWLCIQHRATHAVSAELRRKLPAYPLRWLTKHSGHKIRIPSLSMKRDRHDIVTDMCSVLMRTRQKFRHSYFACTTDSHSQGFVLDWQSHPVPLAFTYAYISAVMSDLRASCNCQRVCRDSRM